MCLKKIMASSKKDTREPWFWVLTLELDEMTAEMLKLVEIKEFKETKLVIKFKIYIKTIKRRLDT